MASEDTEDRKKKSMLDRVFTIAFSFCLNWIGLARLLEML